jgi:hypothetical protein
MMEDRPLLEAALIGYVHQRDQIDGKIEEIRQHLGSAARAVLGSAPTGRTMSTAARKKIATAQKKRWAAYHNTNKPPAKKRRMSAAGRKRIADATRKRWAAYRAAKTKGLA